MIKSNDAEITRIGALSMQVCIPENWDDKQVLCFANAGNPCGTSSGWFIRKEGSKLLKGDPERNPCSNRKDFVHIMLDA